MALALPDGEHAVAAAALLGELFAQKLMFVLSTSGGPGMSRGGAVTVELPAGHTPEQIHAIYQKLYQLTAPNGERIFNGYSAVQGHMVSGVGESRLGLTVQQVAEKISEALGSEFHVHSGAGFIADIPADSYASHTSQVVASRPSFTRQRHDRLRARAATALREALDAERARRWFGAPASAAEGLRQPGELRAGTGPVDRAGQAQPGDAAVAGADPAGVAYEQPARGTYEPSRRRITLRPDMNLSTWLHEFGHFFLHVFEQMAADPSAPADIKDDFATILKWFGGTPEQWLGSLNKEDHFALGWNG